MEKVVIIELHDRFGKVRQRKRINRFPFTIGRGYDCDLILDDKYMSAQHIKLDFDAEGRLIATDLDSDNGLYATSPLKRVDSMWLQSGSRLRIGHTEIQFMFPDHPVREAIPDRSKPGLVRMFFTSWPAMLLMWFLTFTLLHLMQKLDAVEELSLHQSVAEMLPVFLFMSIWAGSWAIAGKLITHRSYFGFHAMLIASLILFSTLSDNLGEYVEFAFMFEGSAYLISTLAGAVLFAVILYAHIRYSTTTNRKKSLRLAIGASAALTLLSQAGTWMMDSRFNHELAFSHPVKAPAFILTAPVSSATFFEQAESIKQQLDEQADEDG